MNNDIKERFKKANSQKSGQKEDSIFDLWEDQKRMQREDAKLARELKEAKKRAKELQKTLRKHQFGESTSLIQKHLSSLFGKLNKIASGVIKKPFRFAKNNKKLASVMSVFMILILGSALFYYSNSRSEQTLGDSTALKTDQTLEIPREIPKYNLLFPGGKSASDYEIVRISPDGSSPSYTYLDQISGADTQFKVTQQEIPLNFDLQKVAESFATTSIIQVNDVMAYHGYSERAATQSLIFVKNDRFVLISSPDKLTDDQWANYILSLK
jgi:hypothetical protein